MTSALQRGMAVMLLFTSLAATAQAEERQSPVQDDAKLFSPEAIAQTEHEIAELHRSTGHDLFIDTIPSAPLAERKWFRFLWTRQVNKVLDQQAHKRAQATGEHGIYVVICNNPRDVHVVVLPADDGAFTPRDCEALRKAVARRLQDSGPDQALLDTVKQVQTMLQANRERGQSTALVSEVLLGGVLGGLVVLWLVLLAVRFKMRRRHPVEEAPEPVERKAALLGSMFGSPAGCWVCDRLFRGPAGTTPLPLSEPEAPAAAEGEVPPPEGAIVDGPPVDQSPEGAHVSP